MLTPECSCIDTIIRIRINMCDEAGRNKLFVKNKKFYYDSITVQLLFNDCCNFTKYIIVYNFERDVVLRISDIYLY